MKKRNMILAAGALSLAGILALPVLSCAQSGGGVYQTGPTMNKTRISPYMTTLSDGRVVIFGGREYNFVSCAYADIYNPTTNSFTEVAMNTPRDMGSVVKLSNGKYFIAGGSHDLGVAPGYNTTEIFDPVANTFTPAATMNYSRCVNTAALLSNGKVLVVGAWYNTPGATYSEVYDPVANTFTNTGAMVTPRANALVLPANDGTAYVLGGYGSYGSPSTMTAVEYYSSADNSFHSVGSEIFPSDPGWIVTMGAGQCSPQDDYKLSDGKYLFYAYRNSPYEVALITFDPATKNFAKLATSSAIKNTYTDGGFFDVVLDKTSGTAYLLGIDSGTDNKIALVGVNVASGTVYYPNNTFSLPASEYLYPNMAFVPSSGKILMVGVSSTTGDYFHATNKTYLITPQFTAGVGDVANELGVTCYPNPAYNTVNFSIDNKLNGNIHVNIYDMTGRMVSSNTFDPSAHITVSVEGYPKGMYFYEIMNNGTVSRDKFIKE